MELCAKMAAQRSGYKLDCYVFQKNNTLDYV